MGSITTFEKKQGHVVCVPFPSQGHITPMMKLAQLLHHRGFHVTFVNTEHNHRRLRKSQGPSFLDGASSFRFATIPDGLPPSNADATQDILSLCISTSKTCLSPFKQLLANLNSSQDDDVPPVSCILADGIMSFTIDAAEELGVPVVLLWTASACGFLAYAHFGHLLDRGFIPLKDKSYLTNGYLNTVIDWIPGMKDIRLKDFPSFLRTTDPNDPMLVVATHETDGAKKASAIVVNTFHALEKDCLDALSSLLPCPVYSIGSIDLITNKINEADETKKIGSNLWKEDTSCLEWLDTKKPNSVVYVNFGSIAVMTKEQMVEFAWGLANSRKTFLWVIRPDLAGGDTSLLPPEFLKATEERGMMPSWCPQVEVLSHPAVGVFLTHCGWNSVLESICGGVPMICWPFFSEQMTNCRYCCREWGVGMEIESDVKREGVEEMVVEMMEGERGKEMKRKVLEWKKMAHQASADGGSSRIDLDKLITEVMVPYNKDC